jgi:hypothetical protein
VALDKLKSDMITDGTIVNADIADVAATKLTGTIADARIPASAVSQHADLISIKQDILTLALHSAIADNKVSYNLPHSFIDQFEDDSGILTETTTDRDVTGEYVSSIINDIGAYTSDSNTLLLLHGDGSNNGTTFTDSSSHNRTATVTNTVVTKTATKKYGTASIYFGDGDGSIGSHGNALSFPDHSDWNFAANPFTIECWMYLTAYPTSPGNESFEVFGQATSNTSDASGGFHFTVSTAGTGKPRANVYRRNGSSTSNDLLITGGSEQLALNTWTHVAVTRESNTLRLYMDGVQIGTQAVDSFGSYTLTSTNMGGNMWISRRAYSTGYGYIRGYVDEYRVSNNCRFPSGTTFTPGTITTINATGTLISDAQTAPSATTSLSGVILYTDNAGTATLGTDLKIYMSADNGSTFTEAASYATAQTFSGSVKMVRLGKTTVTSGTQVKLKAVWANQSSSKETRLNGWAVNY